MKYTHIRAILLGGLFAGTIATVAQLLLWWLLAVPLPDVLYRDTRLTAAILLSPALLAPENLFQTPDLLTLFTATTIHFLLSIAYSWAFFVFAQVLPPVAKWPLGAGVGFGLLLYVINMYGFTALMPWFSLVRDGITVAAHAVFGLCLGLAVRTNTRPNVPLLPI